MTKPAKRLAFRAPRCAIGCAWRAPPWAVEDNPHAIRKAIDAGLLNGISVSGLSKGLPTGPDQD